MIKYLILAESPLVLFLTFITASHSEIDHQLKIISECNILRTLQHCSVAVSCERSILFETVEQTRTILTTARTWIRDGPRYAFCLRHFLVDGYNILVVDELKCSGYFCPKIFGDRCP